MLYNNNINCINTNYMGNFARLFFTLYTFREAYHTIIILQQYKHKDAHDNAINNTRLNLYF